MTNMPEPIKTGLMRGLLLGGVGAAVAFFGLWPQEPGMRELISATVLAGLTPLAGLLGFGELDRRRDAP